MLSLPLRFGPFEVHPASRQVLKHGLPVPIRGQSFDLLLALLDHPGDVVSRLELRHRLWPPGAFIEADDALNTIVNRLRSALRDTAASPRFIETIPRLGYRLRAPLLSGPASSPRIAVLPIANLSGDPAQEYLCDGLTEEMITHLATLPSAPLTVIARTSSMHYRGSRKSLPAIAAELQADYLLEGSLRGSSAHLRVSAQLIETASQRHLWAHSYDGPLTDVLSFQDQVAAAVASEVRSSLAPTPARSRSSRRPSHPPPTSPSSAAAPSPPSSPRVP